MPGRDGTGPAGLGALTGRGLGFCTGSKAVKYGVGLGMGLGLGLACRRGFGRGFFARQASPEMGKELLKEQKSMLQEQLKAINEQLQE
ncbi:MAG: DUF5320 domain-containing protein [Clostridiales bacterium]|jgi:hypothetical protein|nr:DUF5320 domain-containing protein [Clostridiales bacterium]